MWQRISNRGHYLLAWAGKLILVRWSWRDLEPWSTCCLVTQSCLTFCDPMDYSPPGSSVHGIFQARILEWVVIPFSRGLLIQGSNLHILLGRHILYHWDTWGTLGSTWCCPNALYGPMDKGWEGRHGGQHCWYKVCSKKIIGEPNSMLSEKKAVLPYFVVS